MRAAKRYGKPAALAVALAALALAGAACSSSVTVPALGRVQLDTGVAPAAAQPAVKTVTINPVQSPASLTDLQSQYIKVVQTAGPSVVQIETSSGLGSGIIYDSRGDIVTNAHVVGSDTNFTVTTSTGAALGGALVGTDPAHDLAVIRVNGSGLTPATFADSSALQVGDIVLALGSPYGLQGSVTQGLVSALGRSVRESRVVTLSNLIQTSAPINPGNSGGALTDLAGQVVGIPTLGAAGGDGIGFAIPSTTIVKIANHLIANG